jgi:hypothetical protein
MEVSGYRGIDKLLMEEASNRESRAFRKPSRRSGAELYFFARSLPARAIPRINSKSGSGATNSSDEREAGVAQMPGPASYAFFRVLFEEFTDCEFRGSNSAATVHNVRLDQTAAGVAIEVIRRCAERGGGSDSCPPERGGGSDWCGPRQAWRRK